MNKRLAEEQAKQIQVLNKALKKTILLETIDFAQRFFIDFYYFFSLVYICIVISCIKSLPDTGSTIFI